MSYILEKTVTMQKSSDQVMISLEEKRTKMEERQMEIDVQVRREKTISAADDADVNAAKHDSPYATTNTLTYAFYFQL